MRLERSSAVQKSLLCRRVMTSLWSVNGGSVTVASSRRFLASFPRADCPQDHAKKVGVPWVEVGSSITILPERFATKVLLTTQAAINAMSTLETKWDEKWPVIARSVARGKSCTEQQRVIRRGIGDKFFLKHQSYTNLV